VVSFTPGQRVPARYPLGSFSVTSFVLLCQWLILGSGVRVSDNSLNKRLLLHLKKMCLL